MTLRPEKLHRLNPLAALIVELADGRRTHKELLSAVTPLVSQTMLTGCEAWMAQAVAQGILIGWFGALGKSKPFTADELSRLCHQAAKFRSGFGGVSLPTAGDRAFTG